VKHPFEDSNLKAYLDGQLSEPEHSRVSAHLEECPACQSRVETLREQSQRVRMYLASLDAGLEARLLPTTASGRARFAAHLSQKEKENQNMFHKLFSRPYRPAWIAITVIVVLGLALSVPSIRVAAVNLLEIFRVKQIAVIPVSTTNLPDSFKNSGPSIQSLLDDNAKFESSGKPKTVGSVAEASQEAGFAVRLPAAGAEPLPSLTVEPASKGTLTLDVPRINQILNEMNRSDLALDSTLNGATVTANVPSSVTASFGTCAKPSEKAASAGTDKAVPDLGMESDCTVLVQMPSPTVTTPPGLDLKKLGSAFLEMTGMPADQAKSMSERIDWLNTLVIPVPIDSSNYEEVDVDGVTATLVRETSGKMGGHFVMLWVKNGILYGLSGNGYTDADVQLANSLQ